MTMLPRASRPLHVLFPRQEHLSFLSLLGYVFLLKGTCLGKPFLTLLGNNRCTYYKLCGIQLLPLEDAHHSLWP